MSYIPAALHCIVASVLVGGTVGLEGAPTHHHHHNTVFYFKTMLDFMLV